MYRKSLNRASNSGFEVGWKDGRALLRAGRVDEKERESGSALALSVARLRRKAQRVHSEAIVDVFGRQSQADVLEREERELLR